LTSTDTTGAASTEAHPNLASAPYPPSHIFVTNSGATPVLCGSANLLARRQTPLDKQLLQRRKPLSVVSGLAIFALALRFARDLGRKQVDPFRPGKNPASLGATAAAKA
jgi:hypothetical protein